MDLELAQEQEHHETMLPKSCLESSSDGCSVSFKRCSTNSDISSSHLPGHNISVLSDALTDMEMKYFELSGDALSLPPVSMQEPGSPDANPYKIVTHLTSSKSKKYGTQNYDLHLELAKAGDEEVKYKCILQEFWSDTHVQPGDIVNILVTEAVKNQILNRDDIMSTAEMIVQSPKFLHEMYGQGVRESQVLCEVQSYIEPLQTWQKQHVDVTDNSQRPVSEVSVVKIHDIEETIWSPRYGIKGKIDMTVEVKLGKKPGQVIRKVLPLELKTGKASYSVEHKGQVTLYSLMTSDRRDDPEEGLLLYLKQPDMKVIPVKAENKQGSLLQLRNEMAHYLSRQTIKTVEDDGHANYRIGHLPNPIDNLRSCSKCPQLLTCTIFQRSAEELQLAENHAMRKLLPDTLAHCLPPICNTSHTGFYVWNLNRQEHQGDCLQQMVISSTILGVPESQSFTEGKGCCVRFQRRPGFSGCAINTVGINKNDSVVISSEDGRLIALSTGFIKDVSEDAVDIVVDRDSFHDNKEFRTEVFRIDRCDTYSSANYLMSNLARLMESNPHSEKLRSLVIDRKKPEFSLTLSKAAVGRVKNIFRPLNKPQKTAILKVLMCKDYALIKGYPGTGKTSTIVSLVKILKELGHSVLLTSYTHSAVDNILLKLKEDNVPFLRLGRSSRVHPHLQNFVAENLTLNIKSVSELKEFYSSYAIVATSCLGINHPVFQQRKFDICIVDEASQILQPACLGPLFHAESLYWSLGMEESLFSRLDGSGATYELCLQYRMNSTIVQLANDLVYNGALQCGSPAVGCATVQHVPVPLVRLRTTFHLTNTPEWMKVVLDSSLAKAVVFLDTRQISAPEISDGQGFWNKVEASIIVNICHLFLQAGVRAKDVGVIAPYRAQVQHLRRLASQQQPLKGLEINTVDQYQGRDKAIILVSFVRSCAGGGSVGKSGLLQDVRRLNVALTRAKHKLVLVGNTQTLSQYQPLRTLLNSLQERQQVSFVRWYSCLFLVSLTDRLTCGSETCG
ncbi:hypothetical protein C0Q70_06818 [Pomacea canaliculata]|uniref:DNA replication ATP-dependent helicase/nuclease n=1 Tax=Pomacea canaliculata TaxID=400727 RepID=A0A2T7PDA5_POMCA|nr:hypothetical protein C0Q70_06818 [Pomacea canaliculata]